MKVKPAAACVLLLALGISACSTVGGHGSGPVDSFSFRMSANPGLPRDIVGRIIAQGEPELILVVVPHGIDVRRLIASVSLNTTAVIAVMSGEQRTVQANGITANDFSSPVLYSIEIPGGKEPWQYRVVVREADTNARLAKVRLPARAVLQPAFSPTVEQYTVQAPFETKNLSVAALSQSQNPQSITIGGSTTASDLAVAEVDFSSGQQTTFAISVLAEDGVTRSRYSFVVKRSPPDRNALLTVLDMPGAVFTQPFSPAKFTYSALVPFETREVVLNAQAQSPFASVSLTIPGSSNPAIPITRGPNGTDTRVDFPSGGRLPLVLTVTAQDGSTQRYNIEILRREASNNNRLSDLSVSDATLSPAFKPEVTAYVAEIPFSATKVMIRALPQDRNATIGLEKAPAAGTDASVPSSIRVYPGDLAGVQVDFSGSDMKGLNVIATAQNGETQRYTLLLHRNEPDHSAELLSLSASAGTLTPAFSPKVDSYTWKLPADAADAQLTAVAASPFARLSGPNASETGRTQAFPAAVDPGQKTVMRFFVIAEDGTQKVFQVQVARDLPW